MFARSLSLFCSFNPVTEFKSYFLCKCFRILVEITSCLNVSHCLFKDYFHLYFMLHLNWLEYLFLHWCVVFDFIKRGCIGCKIRLILKFSGAYLSESFFFWTKSAFTDHTSTFSYATITQHISVIKQFVTLENLIGTIYINNNLGESRDNNVETLYLRETL